MAGCWLVWFALAGTAFARPLEFDIPAQRADRALLAFADVASVEILFSYDDLSQVQSNAVVGTFEPVDALHRLLDRTPFGARLNSSGKFIVTRRQPATGTIRGILLDERGRPLVDARAIVPDARRVALTDRRGAYVIEGLDPGRYRVILAREGYQPIRIDDIQVVATKRFEIAPQRLQSVTEMTELAPIIVEGAQVRRGPFDLGPTDLGPRRAAGNLDLNRTQNDVLPFTIYDRERITRSGVVNLNEFLRRELLDADATALPPEQNVNSDNPLSTGSSNLTLRGFGTDETIVLVNGRRLPEILTAGSGALPPDVNFIPLSLVQQVQVLPASASALYSGNAVGGVINIVLRPDELINRSEVTATYTNASESFDAAYSSLSLVHTHNLLDGALRLRLNANFTERQPPNESELNYHRDRAIDDGVPLTANLFRATPNIRSADRTSLFGPGGPAVTSVAPGADGTGGFAAFAGREGMRNFDLYETTGGLATSLNSTDFAYGRREKREIYFGSAVYDVTPWLQIGLDAAYATTAINRGFDLFEGTLRVDATSPLNPFGRDVIVALNETAVALGENFNEARLDFYSLVGGVMLRLPADWRVAFDTQYAHSATAYRGIDGVDRNRWQQLVDRGDYNPFRDTQIFGPPTAFYDEVLIFNGHRGDFVTFGDYETVDAALRFTNERLHLPTGEAVLNIGADYRFTHFASFDVERHYGDGTLVGSPTHWQGRSLERVSVFGELQAPVLPVEWLPRWIDSVDTDLAIRFIAADTNKETNLAPTAGFKVDFAAGLTLRGSFTTSNRFPTPRMSRSVGTGPATGGGSSTTQISDPRRGGETYGVSERQLLSPDLETENALTQTVGLIYEAGEAHHLRLALDFFDTQKTNEIVRILPAALMNLEAVFPDRVVRGPVAPGDPYGVGPVEALIVGDANLSRRHSQNWLGSVDYIVSDFVGGTLDLRGRLVYFQSYDRVIEPDKPAVNELSHPSGTAFNLLKYRATFGAGWANRIVAFGLDGQYFHSRILPQVEWAAQGARTIDPYWQFDAFFQADLGHWLLPEDARTGLRAQLRINNITRRDYPFYAGEANDTNVQPYGDWRGRTYSLSVTATF